MLIRARGMVLVILALGAMEPSAQSPALKAVMREKLNNTQQLLEAVITADYAAMERYTERLGRISYTEIASWQAVAQPDYAGQSTRSCWAKEHRGCHARVQQHDLDLYALSFIRAQSANRLTHPARAVVPSGPRRRHSGDEGASRRRLLRGRQVETIT